jgi:DNA-binding NtrC family response regulator
MFLDEIGEMPFHLQVKLLRVLQERAVQPVGAEAPVHVDVRVMAASNRDIEADVEAGRFRADLFYRLSVVTLTIPPLRERREDIPELVESYIGHLRARVGRHVEGITEEALDALVLYEWPGNVRELINVIERALLLCREEVVGLEDLPAAIAGAASAEAGRGPFAPQGPAELPPGWVERPWAEVRADALARLEKAYLGAVLASVDGRVGQAAERAGMAPRSLYEKMKKHGLRKEDYRP